MTEKLKEKAKNCYGKIAFLCNDQHAKPVNVAPYIRLVDKGNCKREFMESVYSLLRRDWRMTPPKLIIEITGAAVDDSFIDEESTEAINESLVQAAFTHDAWLVTGGTHGGVMKMIGNAVLQRNHQNLKLPCLGIAAWCKLDQTSVLDPAPSNEAGFSVSSSSERFYKVTKQTVNEAQNKGKSVLNPGHNYFLLVDTGEDGWGQEIAFRDAFLKYVADRHRREDRKYVVPLVLLAIGGGPNTVKTVSIAVATRPCVILAGTGGAADLIAFAYEITRPEHEIKEAESAFSRTFFPRNFNARLRSYPTFQRASGDDPEGVMFDRLRRCVENRRMITVLRINEGANRLLLDKSILTAMKNAKHLIAGNNHVADLTLLRLAQRWNLHDIGRMILYEMNQNQKQKIDHQIMEQYMTSSILCNQTKFFELFAKKVKLNKYLTAERIAMLYDEIFDLSPARPKLCDFDIDASKRCVDFFKWKYDAVKVKSSKGTFKKHCHGQEADVESVSLKPADIWQAKLWRIGKVIDEVLEHSMANPFMNDDKKSAVVDFKKRIRDLFLMSLILQRDEFAVSLWKNDDSGYKLASALMASIFQKALAQKARDIGKNDLHHSYSQQAAVWQKRYMAMLTLCLQGEPELTNLILTRNCSIWEDKTPMEIAFYGDEKSFIAHPVVQSRLVEIWRGQVAISSSLFQVTLSIFLFPLVLHKSIRFNEVKSNALPDHASVDEKDFLNPEIPSDGEESTATLAIAKVRGLTQNRSSHQQSLNVVLPTSSKDQFDCADDAVENPGTGKSLANWFYVVKSPLGKYIIHTVSMLIFLLLFTYFLLSTIRHEKTSAGEFCLWIWSLMLFVDSCHKRVLLAQSKLSPAQMFHFIYSMDKTMIADCAAIVLIVLAAVFRGISWQVDMFDWAQTCYALACLAYWLRALRIFQVTPIGPKVITFFQMFSDFATFLLIYVILLFAFSIPLHALLHPTEQVDGFLGFTKLLLTVIYTRWWNLAGIGLEDSRCLVEGRSCSARSEFYSSNGTVSFQNLTKFQSLLQLVPNDETGEEEVAFQSNFVAIILLIVYLALTNILLFNLLIGMLAYRFEKIRDVAENLWCFSFYKAVANYYYTTVLPPPLNGFEIINFYIKGCRGKALDTFKVNSEQNECLKEIKIEVEEDGHLSRKLDKTEHDLVDKVCENSSLN